MNTALAYVKIALKSRRSGPASFESFSEEVTVSPRESWLADYMRVTGLRAETGMLPITLLQVLAGSLHLKMLADARVPRSALGLVHLKNVFEQLGELPAGAQWQLRCTLAPVHSSDGKLTGVQLITQAHTSGELRWRSTLDAVWPLPKKRIAKDAHHAGRSAGQAEQSAEGSLHTLFVPGDTGRRYAWVSGDYNPIHMHAATARLFGFPKPIAHGMWTVARVLSAFETSKARRVEARFKRPLMLPGSVGLRASGEGNASLWCGSPDGAKTYLEIIISADVDSGAAVG